MPQAAVQVRAFSVAGKGALRRVHVAVHLPAAAALEFVLPVHKAVHILRRIAQKQADFMRKILLRPEPLYQAAQAAVFIGALIAAVL